MASCSCAAPGQAQLSFVVLAAPRVGAHCVAHNRRKNRQEGKAEEKVLPQDTISLVALIPEKRLDPTLPVFFAIKESKDVRLCRQIFKGACLP